MLLAPQAEGAGQVGIDVAAGVFGIAGGGAQEDARAVHRVRVAGAVQAHVLHVAAGVGSVDLQQPVVTEALFEVGEHGAGFALPVAPLRRQVGRARQVGEVALAVEERHGAPGRTHRVVVLGLVADGDRGAVGQVAFQHGHAGHLVFLVAVVIEISIGIGGDHAAAEAAIGGQRRGHVRLHAAVIPAAGADRERGVEFLARALAQQVHRGRRHAGTAEQAVGTADHFHAVVEGGVVFLVGRAAVGRDAIDLEIGDGETTRVVQRALGVIEGHADAGDVAHHVVDAEQRFVLQALQADHGRGLRGFLQRDRQAGGARRRCRLLGAYAHPVQGLGVGGIGTGIGGRCSGRGHGQAGQQGSRQQRTAGQGRTDRQGHGGLGGR